MTKGKLPSEKPGEQGEGSIDQDELRVETEPSAQGTISVGEVKAVFGVPDPVGTLSYSVIESGGVAKLAESSRNPQSAAAEDSEGKGEDWIVKSALKFAIEIQDQALLAKGGGDQKKAPDGSRMAFCFSEILALVEKLKEGPRVTPYLRANILDPLVRRFEIIGVRDEGGRLINEDLAEVVNDADIEFLIGSLERAVAFFDMKKPRSPGSRPSHLQNKPNPKVTGAVALGSEERAIIQKARRLCEVGKWREAKPMIDTVCNAFRAYQRLWGGGHMHNFMNEEREPHPLIRDCVNNDWSLERFHANNPGMLVVELGCGAGRDAKYLVSAAKNKEIPNLSRYVGIEASPIAANLTRQKLTEVLGLNAIHPRVQVLEGDFVRHVQEVELGRHREIVLNSRMSLAIVSISSLHYYWEEVFANILRDLCGILAPMRGSLVMALKTPDSDTWKQHVVISSKDGYNLGLHVDEGVMRAFMTPEKIMDLLDQAGFNTKNATAYRRVVKGYDYENSTEVFFNVVATPRESKKK